MKLKLAGMVAAAAFAVGLSGCSDMPSGVGGGAGGGGGSKFCTSTSCKAGEACHPTSKTCVKTCTSGTDCTAEAKNCALAVGATASADGGGLLVCNCVTTALCSGSSGVAGNICSDFDKVCVAKCTSNTDCPSGRTCDTATGQCGSASGTDGGTDGGTDAGVPCTRGSCTSPQICDFQSQDCEAPQACSAANVQPDVCGYGQFCSTATCAEVAVGSCSNFAAGSNPLLWNPVTATGPVILQISKVSFGLDTTFCGTTASTRAKFHVKAYAKTAVLISETGQPALNYVRTDGTEISIGAASIQAYTPAGGGLAAEFDFNLCAPTTATSLTVGLYYTGGNGACFTIN